MSDLTEATMSFLNPFLEFVCIVHRPGPVEAQDGSVESEQQGDARSQVARSLAAESLSYCGHGIISPPLDSALGPLSNHPGTWLADS